MVMLEMLYWWNSNIQMRILEGGCPFPASCFIDTFLKSCIMCNMLHIKRPALHKPLLQISKNKGDENENVPPRLQFIPSFELLLNYLVV